MQHFMGRFDSGIIRKSVQFISRQWEQEYLTLGGSTGSCTLHDQSLELVMLLATHGAEMGDKFHLISPSNHSSCCHSPHIYMHKLVEALPVSGSMRMTLPPSIQATQSFPSASMHIPSGICSSFSRWYKSLGQAAGRVTQLMLCGQLPLLYQIPV